MSLPIHFYKSLADETRLKLVILIASSEELCVCDLTDALALSQPKISRHLALLKRNEILLDRKEGIWVYYRINKSLPTWMLDIINTTVSEHQQRLSSECGKVKNLINQREDLQGCCT